MSFLIAPFVQAEVAYRHERIRRDFERRPGLLRHWRRTPSRTTSADVSTLPAQRPATAPTVAAHDSHHAAA